MFEMNLLGDVELHPVQDITPPFPLEASLSPKITLQECQQNPPEHLTPKKHPQGEKYLRALEDYGCQSCAGCVYPLEYLFFSSYHPLGNPLQDKHTLWRISFLFV